MTSGEPAKSRHPSIWFFYLVAASLGISFLGTLLFLAWNNALENETRQFAYESSKLDDTVARNARAANIALENIADLFGSIPVVDQDAFVAFTRGVLARHKSIAAIGTYVATGAAGDHLDLRFGNSRTPAEALPRAIDISGRDDVSLVAKTALAEESVVPTTSLADSGNADRYALLRRVPLTNGTPLPSHGLLVLFVETASLVGQHSADPDLTIKLYSESEGVEGRQLLYSKGPSKPSSARTIDVLEASTLVRLDNYSVRLVTRKGLYWVHLDKAMIFAALVLGVGVTLLLIALARAKDLQARELRERNIVIEDQVERQTKELAETRDQALQASRVKSDFLASMSHEIRTPLNAIIGMAELLSETEMTGDQRKYVSVFRNSGEALLSLVNDILDLSKIEAQQLVLEQIEFSVRDIVDQCVDIHALTTDAKGIELVAHVDLEVPPRLKGDPSCLRQIILNLTGNAVKFTDRGQITVSVRPVPAANGSVRLRFSVADTGIGIPAEKLDSIFASFTQVDSSTTRKYGGTGLGLTISKKLVELMDGRIWVESVEGAGSTFIFEAVFQLGKDSERPAHPPFSDLVRGISVLVVDDNGTNRMILTELLQAEGCVISEASSGKEAIDRYREYRDKGQAFKLILCDARMPEVDGFAVAEAIAADDGSAGTLMMLSSSSLANDLERTRKLGIGHYLVKPVKRADLINGIREMLAPQAAQAAQEVTELAEESAPVSSTILLVEDNPDNRMLIKAYMKREPYEITEAENGQEAVEAFKQGDFDIVLMDVQMPVMDGHKATRAIRAWENEQGREPTTIIALTAHALKEEVDKSLAAGCTAHLTKPIKKQTLMASLAEYLS